MITANLAPTWEHFRAVQARSLVLMKHAQIVTTSPAVSPVMTGMLLIKPAQNNVIIIAKIVMPHYLVLPAGVQQAMDQIAVETLAINVVKTTLLLDKKLVVFHVNLAGTHVITAAVLLT